MKTRYTPDELKELAKEMLRRVKQANNTNGKRYKLESYAIVIEGPNTYLDIHIRDNENWVQARTITL